MNARIVPSLIAAIVVVGSEIRTVAAPPEASTIVPAARPALLSIDTAKDVTVPAPAEAVWNFGRRQVAPGDRIEHTFTLRNPTKAPIILDSLLTSCHCTTATLVRPGKARNDDSPFTLAPSRSVEIAVSVDVDQAHAVDFRKMVWIYVKGIDQAAFTLTIAGTMTSGDVAAGSTR